MKFKNIKYKKHKSAPPVRKPVRKGTGDSGKKHQFPSIYRRITEKLKFRLSWQPKPNEYVIFVLSLVSVAVSTVLIIGIVFFVLMVYQNTVLTVNTVNQRQNIENKINFWQSVIDKYDGYKDAYFQKALLEYQLKDFSEAKIDNQKALLLDPNFEDAKKLENVLGSNY